MNKAYLFYLLRRGIIGGRGSSPWVKIVNDFKERVEGDGGTLESTACLNTDVQFLTENPEPLAAPVNSIAPEISGTIQRGQTLSTTNGTWANGTIVFSYQWKRAGVDISSATSNTYILVTDDDNDFITCNVTATNDAGATSKISNTLGPVLAAPLLLTSPVASGTAQVGQTLSTTDGTWQGIATIAFTYQWRRDASNIGGATSSAYTLVAADYTTDVDCVVTATNGLGNASADSNDIANIAGTAPIISGVPTISAQTQIGQVVTATAASVSGVPTPTIAFQWQRSANGSTGFSNISGATSSTYTLVLADDDKYIRAVQTSTNAIGTDTANSAASAQISDVPAFTGLLDTYSGAAAAYSLRQLSSSYSGNAVRVRRASDNTEQDIGFANNELDTTSLETFCSGTDGFVTTWYDQSGNAANAAQATASLQPKIVASGSTILDNGKAAASFAGDNLISVGASNYSQPNTYFIIANSSVNNSDYSDSISGSNRNLNDYVNANHRMFAGSSFRSSFAYSGLRFLRYSLYNGSSSEISINGASVQIGNPNNQGMNSSFEIGDSTSYMNLQEFILYNSNESTNRTGIETNINTHYSIY